MGRGAKGGSQDLLQKRLLVLEKRLGGNRVQTGRPEKSSKIICAFGRLHSAFAASFFFGLWVYVKV